MKVVSLFSGIDGFALAAEDAGWEVVAHCEIEPFPCMILKDRFPNSILYGDITKTDFTVYRGRVNLVMGGFPCQPVSVAGKRGGENDERFLWGEMLRTVREIAPRWVVAENVRGLLSQSGGVVFEQVCADLEAEGYEVQPFLLPAAGVGAPHERYRIVIVGYSKHNGLHAAESRRNDYKSSKQTGQDTIGQLEGTDSLQSGTRIIKHAQLSNDGRYNTSKSSGKRMDLERYELAQTGRKQSADNSEPSGINATDSKNSRQQARFNRQGKIQSWGRNVSIGSTAWNRFPTQSPVCTGNDGFSTDTLRQRIRADSLGIISEKEIDQILSKALTEWNKGTIKAGGNAVVPQLFSKVFNAINQYEKLYHEKPS